MLVDPPYCSISTDQTRRSTPNRHRCDEGYIDGAYGTYLEPSQFLALCHGVPDFAGPAYTAHKHGYVVSINSKELPNLLIRRPTRSRMRHGQKTETSRLNSKTYRRH